MSKLTLQSGRGESALNAFAARARLLGKGGAGSVYSHPDFPNDAIKIYATTERADAHAAKLESMIAAKPRAATTSDGVVQMAWPTGIVRSAGRFVGFTMPEIDFDQAWTLQQVTQPRQRKRRGVPERLDLRLYAGRNLASVLQALHDCSHYVIDLKPQNVLVYRHDAGVKASKVALVDCDGFQIKALDGRRFDAELATPQFLHPDVARQVGDEASFDPKSLNDKAALQDDFALAIILFQLLNDGLHPMSGVEAGHEKVPTELASRLQAKDKFYAYSLGRPNSFLKPDPDSTHEWFDPELRSLFDRAFTSTHGRPTPREWVSVLGRLADRTNQCQIDPSHWKLGDTCGQCAVHARQQVATVQISLPTAHFAVSQLRTSAPPILTPIHAVAQPAAYGGGSPKPGKTLVRIVLGLVGIVAMVTIVQSINTTAPVPPSTVVAPTRDQSTDRASPMAPQEYQSPSVRDVLPFRDAATAFVDNYYSSWSRSNGGALFWSGTAYAPTLNYYGDETKAETVMAAKVKFVNRWPVRSYVIRPGTEAFSCNSDSCIVSGIVDWTASSPQRNARSSGAAEFRLTVHFADGRPEITAESGRVLRRSN